MNYWIQHAWQKISHTFLMRYLVWFVALGYSIISLTHMPYLDDLIHIFLPRSIQPTLTLITVAISLVGLFDVLQKKHSLLRNYPVMGHFRYLFESIRPEIRQYMIEGDNEKLPFSRMQRSMAYQRSKKIKAEKPFGTIRDVYESGYEFMNHSLKPAPEVDPDTFKIMVGNDQCKQPYAVSIFNISAMSFGSLSANAIRALNAGAKKGGFYHDTGEGSISPFHLENGGDLVWEIGSGYFGCRTLEGRFDEQKFAKQAALPQVKMIEIKLSQGAKPGHGGILPKEKISPLIAEVRGVSRDQDCVSPASHPEFSTPLEMMAFIKKLRDLSGGKPVGFKLCIGHPWGFMGIVKAILETDIVPDFIVVDGAEGGTGAAPMEFSDHLGVPLREGLLFVHNTLVGANLRHRIKLGASGKIISAFDIVRTLAIGADWVNAARGFMFALGCIQSQSCHTNRCPTGIATQDKSRAHALNVPDKGERVYQFHHNTLHALSELIAAAGLTHPSQIKPYHLVSRISVTEVRSYSQLHFFLKPGELLTGQCTSNFYLDMWNLASSESFYFTAIHDQAELKRMAEMRSYSPVA